jgi:phosphoglycolate phosphatase
MMRLMPRLPNIGLPLWTIEQTKDRVRKSMRDSFPEIFGAELGEAAGAAYQAHYRASHLGKLEALPLCARRCWKM